MAPKRKNFLLTTRYRRKEDRNRCTFCLKPIHEWGDGKGIPRNLHKACFMEINKEKSFSMLMLAWKEYLNICIKELSDNELLLKQYLNTKKEEDKIRISDLIGATIKNRNKKIFEFFPVVNVAPKNSDSDSDSDSDNAIEESDIE